MAWGRKGMGGRSWRLLQFGLLRFRANLLFAGGDIHLVAGTLLRPRFLLLVGVISLTIRSRDGIVGKRRGAAFGHGVRHACCGTLYKLLMAAERKPLIIRKALRQ